MLGNVHREGCLAHAWTGGDDYHLGGGAIRPSSGQARRIRLANPLLNRDSIQFLDLIDSLHDQFFGWNNLRIDLFSGDRKNLSLSFIQQRFDFPLLIVTMRRKPVAGRDQPSQDILLADDIDVVACIGSGRNKVVEVAQIFRAADFLQLISIFESLLERDEFDWLSLARNLVRSILLLPVMVAPVVAALEPLDSKENGLQEYRQLIEPTSRGDGHRRHRQAKSRHQTFAPLRERYLWPRPNCCLKATRDTTFR